MSWPTPPFGICLKGFGASPSKATPWKLISSCTALPRASAKSTVNVIPDADASKSGLRGMPRLALFARTDVRVRRAISVKDVRPLKSYLCFGPVEAQVPLMRILLESARAHLDAQIDAVCATERQLVLGHKLELSLAVFVAHSRCALRKGHPPPAL